MAAALLVLVMVPGGVQAVEPSSTVGVTLDQSAEPGTASYVMSNAASQTFTPSLTGLLTNVYLYCAGTGGAEGTLDLSVEGNEASAQCGITAGWVNVAVGLVQVYAGQQATIVISGSEPPVELAGAAADYAGGKATDASGDPISGISDFAFKTYVITASTTTYEWSVPAVTAGSTSTVTLTATTTFDDLTSNVSSSLRAGSAAPDGGDLSDYIVTLETLPSWFRPTGVSCSTQIAPGDCTLDAFKSGIHVGDLDVALPLVVVVTGQAAPAAADGGSTGSAAGTGCRVLRGNPALTMCSATKAGLAVTQEPPTPTPTPTTAPTTVPTIPPTSATTPATPAGGLNWWLPGGLLALLCSLFISARLRERRTN